MNLELFPEPTPAPAPTGWVPVDESDPEHVVYEWSEDRAFRLIRIPSRCRTHDWRWRAQCWSFGTLVAESCFHATTQEALVVLKITLEVMVERCPPDDSFEGGGRWPDRGAHRQEVSQ